MGALASSQMHHFRGAEVARSQSRSTYNENQLWKVRWVLGSLHYVLLLIRFPPTVTICNMIILVKFLYHLSTGSLFYCSQLDD